jgi:hypothetical protein
VKVLSLVRRYPLVGIALLVALAGWRMVKSLLAGRAQLDGIAEGR